MTHWVCMLAMLLCTLSTVGPAQDVEQVLQGKGVPAGQILEQSADPISGQWTDAQRDELTRDGNLLPDMLLFGGAGERTPDGVELTNGNAWQALVIPQVYKTPLRIEVVARTDTTNIRLYFARGEVIFNWEINVSELRIHDPKTGNTRGFAARGKVPADEWQTIVWEIAGKKLRVLVNGKERASMDGDYAGVEGRVGIGAAGGSTVTVKSVKAAPLGQP